MALTLTLADSLKLTTDTLQAGVIETLATESKILARLPFMNIEGSGYSYNVETELSDVQFRDVGEVIAAGKVGLEQRTEALKILADEAIIDTFQVAVYSNINDLMAIEVQLKTKAIAHKFEKTFISGDSDKNAKEFDGIDKRLIAGQKLAATSDLFKDVRKLRNMVQGTPDAYIMNKDMLVDLEAEYKNYITWSRNEFGVPMASFGGISILDVEPEVLPEAVIYAVKFGPKEAVCGLQNGGVQVKALGETDSAPQFKTRIEWFVSLAVFNDKTIAKREVKTP